MNNISVNMEGLGDKISNIQNISNRVSGVGNKLASIRSGLDSDVKYRQNIDGKLRNLCREINNLEKSINRTSEFINQAITAYADVEKKLMDSFNEINEEPKADIIDLTDKIEEYYLSLSSKIADIFGVIQSTIKSSIAHLIDFFDKDSDEVITNKQPKQEDVLISMQELEGILTYDNNKYNEYVKLMQQRLNELGYRDSRGKPLAEDGYFGDRTLEAITKFKENNKLWNFGEYEGKVGETTWEYLFVKAEPIVINEPEDEKVQDKVQDKVQEKPKVENSTRKYGNPSYDEIVNYIEQYCDEIGLPKDIGLAIAWTESRMTQYEGDNLANANENKNKNGKVTSTDWGIMQLNDKSWSDKYDFEHIRNDWEYNVRCGLDVALNRYNEAIRRNESDIPRATYSGYNTWSNIDRYRTEKDQRDINFYTYYKTKPWESMITNEQPNIDDNHHNQQETEINTNSNYNMVDTTSWNAVKPKYTYNSGPRTPEAYNKLIDQFNVESNPRYVPRGGATYCNIYAWDISIAMGVELPRFVEINQKGNLEDATGKAIGRNLKKGYILYQDEKNATATELNANRLAIWLDAQGKNYGWKEITPEEAQKRANEGYMTISCIDESPSIGHVQVVRPTPDGSEYNSEKGVYLAQAGGSSSISNGLYFKDKYESEKYYNRYKFYTHD
ncbi:peptidoglycan-binding domain-containing protein [Vallitalea guaymasensis]|uniref:peptidoglycan-binding domain-containing protein n=1 Tax=Vallitalea guaymasensis TaxID=1185412 RepID=UPI0023551CF3|nr:peptidoglycan-binding protein [Vallitalea guaymasensis]